MNQDSVRKGVKSPEVRRPVGMAKATGERKESFLELRELIHGSERAQSSSKDR